MLKGTKEKKKQFKETARTSEPDWEMARMLEFSDEDLK